MLKSKRIISFMMAFIMLFTMIPVQTFANVVMSESENESLEKSVSPTVNEQSVILYEENGIEQVVAIYSEPIQYELDSGEYYFFINEENAVGEIVLSNESTDKIWNIQCDFGGVTDTTVDGITVNDGDSIALNPEQKVTIGFKMVNINSGYILFTNFVSKAASTSGIVFMYNEDFGSITVNGQSVENGESFTVPKTGASIVATAKNGGEFLGWVDATDDSYKIINREATIDNFVPSGQKVVKAAFANSEAIAWFYAGKDNAYLFDNLTLAGEFAAKQDYNENSWWNSYDYRIITLAASGKLEKGTYNIPKGAKLLIPYTANERGTFNKEPEMSETTYGASQHAFRSLTLEENTILNCSGQLNINGRLYKHIGNSSGITTDTYGCIHLNKNANLNINEDGILYCYGYITGEGVVTAHNGSTVYEVLQMNGWPGGTVATSWMGTKDENKVNSFVFNDYAIQNIESNFDVKYGAEVGVVAAVTVTLLGTKYADTVYIGTTETGTDGSGLIRLGEGASVYRSFTPETNRVQYIFYGKSTIANIELSLNVGTTINMDSALYILAINHYMDFVAAPGSTVTLSNDYKLLPGATLTAAAATAEKEAAEVIVNGNLYIYDTKDYVGKGYVSGNSVPVKYVATTGVTAGSLPKMNSSTPSGKVVVDGRLTINGNVYTTEADGTSVDKCLTGTGTIINNSTANAAVTDVLDEFKYEESQIVDCNIRVVPVVGQLAGFPTETGYHSFSKGTYTGLGKGYWYQNTVGFTGALDELKTYNGSVITVEGETVTGYSCTGGTLQFTLPFNYTASCTGAVMTQAAAPGSAVMVYSVPINSNDVAIVVNEAISEANNATIKFVSKEDGSVVASQEYYIPVGTDVSSYYSDEACSAKATTFASGDVLYILVGAKVGEDEYYSSLEEAINNAVGSGDVVTLLSDVYVTSPITVYEDQDIDIRLNGHDVTYSDNVLQISGSVDLDLQGGSIMNAQGAEVSALIVRNGGTLNLDMNGGALTWSDYGVEGYSFSTNSPVALIHCYDGGTANINMGEGDAISVIHPNAVTTYTLHGVINNGTMTINGVGTITSDAYTNTSGAYVNSGSDTYNAAPPVVNNGQLTIQNGTKVSSTSANGTKNYAILNYDGGHLVLDDAEVSCASGYAVYNWGATIDSIKDTMISGTNGICNYNMDGFDYTATITEIVGESTIEGKSGYALSTHPETYIGIIGGKGSDVELIATGNTINGNEGKIGELADGLTIISTGGHGVYTKGTVDLVSRGYYCTAKDVFYADTGTEEIPYNASITIPEGYHLSTIAKKCTLRNGKSYNCTYLTSEQQNYPDVLAGHLQEIPEDICGDVNIWGLAGLTHESVYYGGSSWTVNGDVVSITIPVSEGDRIYANSFGNTTLPDGTTVKPGIRVTWFGQEGVIESVAPGTVYSKYNANGYLTAPAGTVAVCIPMWMESEENVVNILGHEFEYVDEDADGRYIAVCSACGTEHTGLEEHLQISDVYCNSTNLWTVLKPEKSRRTATAWATDYYSITFPVVAGDRIWANSFQAAGSNDHTANGIRVTWFNNDGKVSSFDANTIYAEFSKNVDETSGKNYITAPDNAIAICVTMWKNNSNSAVQILNADHLYEHAVTEPTCGNGYTTHTCSACGDEYVDSYTDPIGDHKFTNYISNGDATKEQDGTKTAVCDYGCGTENTVIDEGSSDIYRALQGKVISVMGDSISTFAGWIPTADGFNLEHYARYPQDNLFNEVTDTWWYQLIFDELDAKLGVNESWRSTEIGNVYDVEVNSGYEGTKACMASMTRIQNLGSNGTPDLILFYGGTNDITQRNNADIPRVRGSFDESMVPEEVDLETDMWDTVIEAYVTALMRMNHFYPDARIVCMFPTVTRTNSETVVSGYNAEFKKACDYFIAEGYDIVYLDLLESGVTTDHLPDGTHPNAEGMDLITAAVKSKILETCTDMTVGEHVVHAVTHNLSNVKGSKSYYKGLSDSKTFSETLTGDNIAVTVTMNSEDITAAVCTYNDDKSEAYINVTDVSDDLVITAEGTYDPSSLYGDRLQPVPENICSGFNLLDQLDLDSGYFREGAWDTSKYYSLTISVNPGDKLWATSFQAAGLNGATSANGVRITWFKNDGSVTEVESEDVYDEFVLNKYITVPEDTAAVSIPLRTDSADNAVYIMGLDHTFVEENNGDGTETLKCTICGHETTQMIGEYLDPYIQMIPEKTYNTTNLWPLLEHNQKYYKTTVNETKTAYNEATWGTNGAVRSVTIPVGSGYRIYATSLVATNGIRITWFYEDETFVSWKPADAHSYFTKNTDETTGLHYIAAPEGAIAVNVAMWDDSATNELYVLNLPVDPLTLHGLPSHLRDLPEPCYNTTNIWAELAGAGQLDEKYWNGTTWGVTGSAKSVTVRVNGGDKLKATSFGTSEGNNGIRVTWFLDDGSTPKSMGKDEVYKEFTDNGYLTAPENAVAVCVPMWVARESCEFYNLSLPDDPILAYGLSDHLVDLPEPCYNDTNIWAELAKAEKLDPTYWNGSTWGTTGEAKSVTIRVNGGDKLKATSFGYSEGNEGIRVTWFLNDGSTPKSMAKQDVYTEFENNGYLTAPENAIAVCVPMWVARESSEFYNLSLPDRPLSGTENYNGKVISIMGDSISTFAGYTPVDDGFNLAHRNRYPQSNLSMDVNETWWMQVLTELDAKLGINDSWAGSKVNNTSDTNSGDKGPDAAMASLTRIQNLGANGTPDVILVFGGTNDRGSTLGSFDAATAPAVEDVDLESYKWDNFVDAYVAMITRMMHYYPDAEIVAMMPYMPNAASMNVEIAKICDHYGIAYTDLMECGIQITTEHLPDDLHPNAAGFDYITDAVLDVLLNDVEMTDGEHTVYPITHELTNATATKHYYKGVSSGARFEETISSAATANVTVTMGDVDITESAYNKETGVIEIESVTGEIVITVSAEKTMADRIQELPNVVYRDTNLWSVLTPQPEYYGSSNTWESGTYSITIPVTAGDQIWATAFGVAGTNGGDNNGIRVTWFTEDYSVLESVGPAEVHSEFLENGYLTVPENAKYVNIPAWKTADFTNVINILNRPTVYDEYLIDLDLESICSNTDVWDLLKDEWNTKYWNSGWILSGDVRSITIPINENDQIKANVFGTTVTSGGSNKTGIRVTWFNESGVLNSEYISEANGNLSAEGYITAPAGAVAVNLPVWDSKVENDMYILTLDHSYTGDWVIAEEGHARKCGSCDTVDPEIGEHIDENQDNLCDECGYEMGTPEHSCTAGAIVIENEKAATCTEDGSYDEVTYCIGCGTELSRETITVDAQGHTPGEAEEENRVEPSEIAAGSYDSVIYCTECRTELSRETIEIPATGSPEEPDMPEHTHEYGEVTYTGDGMTSYTATRSCECEDVQTTEAAITVTITKDATCTETGEKTYTATFSADWAVDKVTTEDIPMIDHNYGDDWKYDETGHWHVCTCGAKSNVEGHNSSGPATENTAETCTICGYEIAPKVDHEHIEGEVVVENEMAATCTEDGSYDNVVYCTDCDTELSRETITVDALGHNFVEGKCSVCGEAEEPVDPPVDPDEPIEITVDVVGASNSAQVQAPEGGWKLGENTFAVSSEDDIACVVLVKDSEDNYTRLSVTTINGNHYFTVGNDFNEKCKIIVAVKGDISGDGMANATDARQIVIAANSGTALDDFELLCADASGDNAANATDARQIVKAANGGTAIDW